MALTTDGSMSSSLTSAFGSKCTHFTLPSPGVVEFGISYVVTLTANAVYKPTCTPTLDLAQADVKTPSSLDDLRDPFYASTLPQTFALAATTVISYMLVIMLFITPRTFLSGSTVILGGRRFANGNRGSGVIGIGGRPWLQKVAALTVAVSLTIATVDTFRVAQEQYDAGNPDAKLLQEEVLNSTELKVIRVISDTFLWLAQAQTLIRLFPRHREKVIIKWTAFALILLDLIFSILNNFVFGYNNTRPRTFEDAIPALSYLFQLALGLLYCAWVIYYGVTKKTYAFYHPNMRNICLVALLSIIAVIVPVVFFVLDISKPKLAGWGDYVRWVGAAAASVVVWEWVERIEALERNDKKDGVLGREVFDGDEMLEVTPSYDGLTNSRRRGGDKCPGGGGSTGIFTPSWPAISGIAHRYRPRQLTRIVPRDTELSGPSTGQHAGSNPQSGLPARPLPAATPISRTDTASAESTVYAIRYHPVSESRGATEENTAPSLPSSQPPANRNGDVEAQIDRHSSPDDDGRNSKDAAMETSDDAAPQSQRKPRIWQNIQKANPFRRKDEALPREVSAATGSVSRRPEFELEPRHNKWDVLGRLEDFAALQADKLKDKARPNHENTPLPVTRIPAPTRSRALHEIAEEIASDSGAPPPQLVAAMREDVRSSPSPVHVGEGSSSPLRDRYRSAYIDEATVTHRGSLSFVNMVRRDDDVSRSSPSGDEQPESRPYSPGSRDVGRSHSAQSRVTDGVVLPVRRIPPPIRRTYSGD